MQITIDTRDELLPVDRTVLAVLIGAQGLPATPGTVPAEEGLGPRLQREAKERAAADRKATKTALPAPEEDEDEADEPEVVEVTEPEPQPKRAPRRRAAAKPKPEPEPEPEEDEDAESEDEGDEEDLIGGGEPTLDDAVAQATELVGSGQGAKVKAALKKVGAARVSALKGKAIAEFLAAIA